MKILRTVGFCLDDPTCRFMGSYKWVISKVAFGYFSDYP